MLSTFRWWCILKDTKWLPFWSEGAWRWVLSYRPHNALLNRQYPWDLFWWNIIIAFEQVVRMTNSLAHQVSVLIWNRGNLRFEWNTYRNKFRKNQDHTYNNFFLQKKQNTSDVTWKQTAMTKATKCLVKLFISKLDIWKRVLSLYLFLSFKY